MTSITLAGPICVRELATILAPQNRTQGRCDMIKNSVSCFHLAVECRVWRHAGLGGDRGAALVPHINHPRLVEDHCQLPGYGLR